MYFPTKFFIYQYLVGHSQLLHSTSHQSIKWSKSRLMADVLLINDQLLSNKANEG